MARGTWSVEKKNGTWVSDGTLYKPNENLSLDIMTTQQKYKLASGGNAFLSPETKYTDEPMVYRWLSIEYTDTFQTKIRDYVKNQDYLRITDHKGNTYIGRFITIRRVWISGIEDTYDIEAAFEQME